MDTDWCLNCSRRTNGVSPYCSTQCRSSEASSTSACPLPTISSTPSSLDFNEDESSYISQWPGKHDEGIRAWASHVHPGLLSSPSSCSIADSSVSSGSSSSSRPRPALMRPPSSVTPSLCISRPQASPVEPSLPIATPLQQHLALSSPRHNTRASVTTLATTASHSIPTPGTSVSALAIPSAKASVAQRLRTWGAGLAAGGGRTSPYLVHLEAIEAAVEKQHHRWDEADDDDCSSAAVYVGSPFAAVKEGSDTARLPRRTSRLALDNHPIYASRGRSSRRQ